MNWEEIKPDLTFTSPIPTIFRESHSIPPDNIMNRILLLSLSSAYILQSSDLLVQAQCSQAKDFTCGFESVCPCWRQGKNRVEDDIDWNTGTKVASVPWNSIPRSRNEQNSIFAYGVRDGAHLLSSIPRGAMLISKRITCTDKPITVKLWYWKAAFIPQIRVCYKYFNESKLVQCSAEVNGFQPPDWLPLVATLPPIKREFQIVVQAVRLFGLQTVVAIDDISLEGDLTCENSGTVVETAVKANVTNDVTVKTGETKNQECSDMKLMDAWTGEFNKGVWQVCENGTRCKQLTGIGAATAWDVKGDGNYVLESQKFKLESESVLRFQFQFVEKSFTSKLRVCTEALDACPFMIRGSSQDDKWSEESVLLDEGWHKVFFTVTNLKKSDHVKIRRIIVKPKEDISLSTGHCTLMMSLIDE